MNLAQLSVFSPSSIWSSSFTTSLLLHLISIHLMLLLLFPLLLFAHFSTLLFPYLPIPHLSGFSSSAPSFCILDSCACPYSFFTFRFSLHGLSSSFSSFPFLPHYFQPFPPLSSLLTIHSCYFSLPFLVICSIPFLTSFPSSSLPCDFLTSSHPYPFTSLPFLISSFSSSWYLLFPISLPFLFSSFSSSGLLLLLTSLIFLAYSFSSSWLLLFLAFLPISFSFYLLCSIYLSSLPVLPDLSLYFCFFRALMYSFPCLCLSRYSTCLWRVPSGSERVKRSSSSFSPSSFTTTDSSSGRIRAPKV